MCECEGTLRRRGPGRRTKATRAAAHRGAARAHDGIIACGLAAIWRIDSARHFGTRGLPHNDITRITRTSHRFTKHKIPRRPRHPVSGGREARRGPHGRVVHNCVIGGWSSAAMVGPAGAEPMTSSYDSRRCRQPRSSAGPGSNGMMAAPPSYHFRPIGWGIPSRWKTMRTSDELLRSP